MKLREAAIIFFDSATPNARQLDAVEKSQELHRGMATRFSDFTLAEKIVPDSVNCLLVICGPQGSGKTATLIACAFLAAAVHGQAGLLICADSAACQNTYLRLQQVQEQLAMEELVGVGVSNTLEWNTWLSRDKQVPHLWAMPLSDACSWFLDNASHRASLRRIEWIGWDDIDRAKQPAMKKQLLAAIRDHKNQRIQEALPFQLVLSCSELGSDGLDLAKSAGCSSFQPHEHVVLLTG